MKKLFCTVLAVLLCWNLTSCMGKDDRHKVIFVSMDQQDQYWNNIDAGCRKAAAELQTVDYKWTAPDVKDSAKQIEVINNAVADGADAILLTAVSMDSVNDALQEACDAGVRIVYVDSVASFSPVVATLCTDNRAAGKTAGHCMLEYLAEQGIEGGKIGIVGVNSAVASAMDREMGFRDAFVGTNFELLDTEYCDGDFARSKDAASALIADGCVGVFGTNEGSTVGVGNAIRESGGTVVGIGFDNSDNIMELLEGGYLTATMMQSPETMGYEGLKAAVRALEGDPAMNQITDTGVTVLTKETIDRIEP